MTKRGPKSAASLAIVAPTTVQPRVKPQRKLSPAEIRHWVATVDSLPAGYFGSEHAQQLAAYCQHAALAEMLAEKLMTIDPTAPEWSRVNAGQVQHSKAALAYARSLRLTVNSRADRDTAAAAAKKGRTGPATLDQLRQRFQEVD